MSKGSVANEDNFRVRGDRRFDGPRGPAARGGYDPRPMIDVGAAPEPTTIARSSGDWRWILGLLAIAIPLLLFRLGAKDVWEASEGRPLESAREMRAHGDWLVQYTNGQKDLTKPPLYAWMVGVAFSIGGDTEFAGRVPSVLASIGVLLLVFVLARRIAGPRAGFLSAVLLLTTAKFLWQARLAELETLLALGVMGAYVCFDAAAAQSAGGGTQSPSARGPSVPWGPWLGFGTWLGFAAAVKGPVAFLLVLPGVAVFAMKTQRARLLRSGGFVVALLIAVAIGAAWPAAVVLRDGREAYETLVSFARGDNVGHLHDPFYYLAQYPLYALPWTPFVILALRMRWARDLDPVASTRARLPLVAFAVTFVLQSLLSAKQTHYLIPTVFPMGAVLAGVWLDRRFERSGDFERFRRVLGAGVLLIASVATAAVVGRWSHRPAGHIAGHDWATETDVVLLAIFLLAAFIVLTVVYQFNRSRAFGGLIVVVLALATFAEGWVVPGCNGVQSSRRFIERADQLAPSSALLAWTTFGSHSDYLWHFSTERIGTHGIPELVGRTELETLENVRRYFSQPAERYAIVFGEQAEKLRDAADAVVWAAAFQRKSRLVALLKSKEPR
jgi:4-amino-4-deoxy-L-arabinose transferase-like glycosyltransferase